MDAGEVFRHFRGEAAQALAIRIVAELLVGDREHHALAAQRQPHQRRRRAPGRDTVRPNVSKPAGILNVGVDRHDRDAALGQRVDALAYPFGRQRRKHQAVYMQAFDQLVNQRQLELGLAVFLHPHDRLNRQHDLCWVGAEDVRKDLHEWGRCRMQDNADTYRAVVNGRAHARGNVAHLPCGFLDLCCDLGTDAFFVVQGTVYCPA